MALALGLFAAVYLRRNAAARRRLRTFCCYLLCGPADHRNVAGGVRTPLTSLAPTAHRPHARASPLGARARRLRR